MSRRRFRRVLRAATITIASIAGYYFAVFTEQERFELAALPAFILFVVSMFEFLLNDIIAARTFPETTLSKMEVLRHVRTRATLREIAKVVAGLTKHPAFADVPVLATVHLRIEVFSPFDEEERAFGLLQLVDYQHSPAVPAAEPRAGRFRVTSQYQGLIGRCLRTEREDYVKFTSQEEYFEKMVRDFGFSNLEAAKHSKNARSYYASPIKSEAGSLVAILYMYSTHPDVFPDRLNARSGLRQTVVDACRVIGSLLAAQELGTA